MKLHYPKEIQDSVFYFQHMEPSRILYGQETPLRMFASRFSIDSLIIFELGISLPRRRRKEGRKEGPLIPFLIPFLKAVRKANRIDANRICKTLYIHMFAFPPIVLHLE